MAENDELSPRQLTAIASLLQHGTVTAAAKDADVPERTFYNWLALPEFTAELKRRQSELVDGAYRRLQASITAAVDVLTAIMADTSIAPGIRLRAADSVLSNALRWAEHTDLAQRLDALEAAIATSMLIAAVTENSNPVEPARRVIDYRLKMKAPDDGDDQS